MQVSDRRGLAGETGTESEACLSFVRRAEVESPNRRMELCEDAQESRKKKKKKMMQSERGR